MKKILLIALLVGAFVLSGCSSDGFTDPSMRTLRYEKGASQGGKFKECIDPGEKIVTNDALYPYPTTQREDVWDTANFNAGSNSADHEDLRLTDRNGNTVNVKMKVSFFLNTDCDPIEVNGRSFKGGALQAFHEFIGKTRRAYFNKDGSYPDGWIWAMDNYISSSVVDYMTKATRTQTAEDMWLKPEINADFTQGLSEALPGLVNAGMETDIQFYRDFTVKIYSITPGDEYLSLYKDRQNAKIKAETAEANKQARIAEAQADAAVAEEQAKVRKAEIQGYGGPQWYACVKSIEKNLPCFTPNGSVLVNPR